MIQKLLDKMQINTIRTKLILAFIFVGLVPFLLFAFFSYKIYFGALNQKISDYSEQVVNGMQKQLDDYLQDIAVLLEMKNNYYINQSIKLVGAGEYSGNRKYFFRLWEDFNTIRNLKSGLEEFSLTFDSGLRLSNYGLYYLNNNTLEFLQQKCKNYSQYIYTAPHFNFYNQRVITVAKRFNDRELNQEVIISADIALSYLKRLTDVKFGSRGYIFITDNTGKIIYHPQKNKIGSISKFYTESIININKGSLVNDLNGEKHILNYSTSKITGWKVISATNASQVTAELDKLKRLTFIGVSVIISSLIFLIVYLSAFLTKPIKKLESVTKLAADNNLDVNINIQGNDEIANLSNSFKKMMKRIKELVAQNIEEQKQIRDLELKSLHEQIKPHFIYNTLDLIIGQLEKEKDKKYSTRALNIIEELGKFFRLSFSRGREMVRLSNEIQHVKSYLEIQKQRFEEEFEFVIDIKDKKIKNYYIPKLLLQPLIENAIYHGVLKSDKKGLIVVKAELVKEKIILEVIDNGRGIPDNRLKQINNILTDNSRCKEGQFFGLCNVNNRIKYKYGPEYGLELKSTQGIKTVSRIVIGIIDGGDDD